MPKYVTLVNWTEQGVRNVAENCAARWQFQQMIAQMGSVPVGDTPLDAGALRLGGHHGRSR